ncbi:ABC transporter substrate-binding protein [Spelaeicoccus albus]|uniref:NitT/TauT family transport system substrate-binding protein n=1 Tax=Spelaeicoccus albus TaxID=1280376 RepID=A0A7Z0AAB1_9MICO|nr:ABC transporter substrate-binding protein [Spelaeicoccus albus]NYI67339.1 NitT/TauT family transport system substrate-binding protein [Spelaeicoccus albus]
MNTISRRLMLLAAATGPFTLAACSNSPAGRKENSPTGGTTGGHSSVTVGLTYTPNIQFAPFYAAKSLGYYSDAGLDVTLRHHGASESEFGALSSGAEDFINAGGDEIMQARAAGTPVVDIATLYAKYPVALIVPADSPIKKAADMKGRTIGTPGPYGETYFALLAMLRQAGLSKKDVTVKYIGFTQQAALAGHKVDGVMGFVNNDAVQFKLAGIRTRSIGPDGSGQLPLVGLGIGAMEKTLKQRPRQARRFVLATLKGVDFMTRHPTKTVDLSAKFVPTMTDEKAKSDALATLRATIPLVRGTTGHNDPSEWRDMAAFMHKAGLVKHPVKASDAYSNDFV